MQSRQPRVLFLLPSIRAVSPVLGTLALARSLDGQCDLVVGHLDDERSNAPTIRRELEAAGMNIRGFRCHGWTGLASLGRMRAEIAAARFDVVHSYGIRPDLVNAFAGHGAARFAFLREDFARNYAADFGAGFGGLVARLEHTALNRMDRVVVISESIRRSIEERGIPSDRVTVIPNLLNRERLDSSARRARSRQPGTLRLGYAGRLISLKRVDWVIRAIAAVTAETGSPRLTLDVAGEGPLRSQLEDLARELNVADCVRFHGSVEDINAFFEGIDLFVLTSSSEGVPRSVMEAMYVGVTCVAPRVGGVGELIEDGRTGFLFNATSYDDFVTVLRRVVSADLLDPEEVGKSIEAYSNDDKAAELLMRTYEEVVSNRRQTERHK